MLGGLAKHSKSMYSKCIDLRGSAISIIKEMAADNTDFQAIPVEAEDKESCKLQKPLDCFSILCGVLAALLFIILLAVMMYYFCTPSIANKK